MNEHLEHGYVYVQQYMDKFEKLPLTDQSSETIILSDQSQTTGLIEKGENLTVDTAVE